MLSSFNQLCCPNPSIITDSGLGSIDFARHYFRYRFFFLFLWVLRCFSSPRSLLTHYFTHVWITGLFFPAEFPHSEIPGSKDMCSSPRLIAACHVFHRLLVPRHSPYALSSLTYVQFLVLYLSLFLDSKTLWFNIFLAYNCILLNTLVYLVI